MKSPLPPAPANQRWLYKQAQEDSKKLESSKKLSNQIERPQDVKQTSSTAPPQDGKKLKMKKTFAYIHIPIPSVESTIPSVESNSLTSAGYIIAAIGTLILLCSRIYKNCTAGDKPEEVGVGDNANLSHSDEVQAACQLQSGEQIGDGA